MNRHALRPLAALLLAAATLTAQAAERALPAALEPYAGKVVYVDFWASWCGPCAESFPWLNQLQARHAADLVVVGVNLDAEASAADAFLRKHPASFAIVRDPEGTLPELYRIEGMPSSVILGPDGRVLHRHAGFRKQQIPEYEMAVRKALAAQPETNP